MWGVIPAAGKGSRIQPLAFSKELLPVGSVSEGGQERPRAVSEYLVERMVLAGADKICFVISPGKSDIFNYFGGSFGVLPRQPAVAAASICYAVQQHPAGLCDAIFRALPLIPANDQVLIGLPDTIWFPDFALAGLPDDCLSFLLFPVNEPRNFDAVLCDMSGRVSKIQVKDPAPQTNWVWGAIKASGQILQDLHSLWQDRECRDEYLGTLVNEYLAQGGEAWGFAHGESYVDVGTLNGYRQAMRLLDAREADRTVSDAMERSYARGA